MRTPIIAANWKMHKTRAEVEDFVAQFAKNVLPEDREVIIAASPTLLATLADAVNASGVHINVAAQNMYFEESGAFTGETSALQVHDAGATHVIIGHSERRHLFGEDNVLLNKKLVMALHHQLTPIYCVGETLDEREGEAAEEVVREQLNNGFSGLTQEMIENMIVAYEPVWAIGSGESATPAQAEEMHAMIRTMLPEKTRVIYGGSVTPDNAAELFAQPNIDGFLVGGASLEPESFAHIVNVQ